MVDQVFPGRGLLSQELLSGGCSNLNFRVQLAAERSPLILRVYLREREAASREQRIAALLRDCVAIPEVYFVDEYDGYQVALVEYCEGITLREVLLEEGCEAARDALVDAGQVLSALQEEQFVEAGFFDGSLSITSPITPESYLSFGLTQLENQQIKGVIGEKTACRLQALMEEAHFSDRFTNSPVHGDFAPENLLVKLSGGSWRLSAVLDWEFAFSGSVLTDIASMTRYSHRISPTYEAAFLEGVKQGGIFLHEGWRREAGWLNVLALMDCLRRSTPEEHPNRCADIVSLVDEISSSL